MSGPAGGAANTALLVSKLRSAREALCVAQTHCTAGLHREDLQQALDRIDLVGLWYGGPDWSSHNLPPLPELP